MLVLGMPLPTATGAVSDAAYDAADAVAEAATSLWFGFQMLKEKFIEGRLATFMSLVPWLCTLILGLALLHRKNHNA